MAPNPTEQFVQQHFINDNGTMATYIHETAQQDADFVKGREALSETLGLWMEYAVLMEDKVMFADAFAVLQTYFLEEEGFIHWKLLENGKSEVSANALVDDLRIIRALLEADALWPHQAYHSTAINISDYLAVHHMTAGIWTDFYDEKYDQPSEKLTLSYVEPEALGQMHGRKMLPADVYNRMMELLIELPKEEVFFPKFYHAQEKTYTFDEEVNMIDQALVALNLAKADVSTEQFQVFLWQEIEDKRKIYGKYERKSMRADADYESPAVYGFLILYSLEIRDEALTKRLYNCMKLLQNRNGKYEGAYAVAAGNTHIFDQLVPLLAETQMVQAGLVPASDK